MKILLSLLLLLLVKSNSLGVLPFEEENHTFRIDQNIFHDLQRIEKEEGKVVDIKSMQSGPTKTLIDSGEKFINTCLQNRGITYLVEDKVKDSLKGIKKNLILEATRGVNEIRVYRQAASAVVLVLTQYGIGSGSIFDRKAHILTNWHMVRDNKQVVVIFKPKGQLEITEDLAYVANVIKIDQLADLALLEIENPPPKYQSLNFGDIKRLKIGQDVHAIGHPEGEIWTYTAGIVSQIRPGYEWSYGGGIIHKSKVIQTQTPINPGNSGGPLLNDGAEIIGINSFGSRGEGLNFAVAVDVIRKFLKRKEDRLVERPWLNRLAESVGRFLRGSESSTPEGPWGRLKGEFTYVEYDRNNDQLVDLITIDVDGDEKPEVWQYDNNQDGETDYYGLDENKNGAVETIIQDLNADSIYETYLFDKDEDGNIDLIGLDFDGDYKIDRFRRGTQ